MVDENSLKVMYEARRQARGGGPFVKPRRWRRRLIVIGVPVLVVGAAGIAASVWWSHTHVRTVRATVSAAFVSLSPNVDARVQALHVATGDRVVKGQPLLRFDDSEAKAALEAATAEKAMAASKHVQADATARRTEMRVAAEIELAQAGVEVAATRLASIQASLGIRKARLPEEIRCAQAERDEARARLDRLKAGPRSEDIETAKIRLTIANALAEQSAAELRQVEQLAQQGVESRNAVQSKRSELTARQGATREAELTLARLLAGPTREEIEATTQVLAAREATLALATAAGREIEALTADLTTRQAELHQAKAGLQLALASRLEITFVNEQVKAAASDLRRAEAQVAGRRAALETMSILSPVEGTVIRTFQRPGEVCRKGETAILVRDDSAGRWVEGYVREEDAHYIEVGQRARVTLVTGDSLQATVEAVALSTSSLGRPTGAVAANSPPPDSSVLVWVRLRLQEGINSPLPGTSARAVIRIR